MSEPPPLPMPASSRRFLRLSLLFGLMLMGAVGAWWLATVGPGGMPLRCYFHDFTGLHCPGCGMTRGAHALLEGRLIDAFRFNPVGMVLLPLSLLILAYQAWHWAWGSRPGRRLRFTERGAVWFAIAVIAFWILRNLPWWPFTLLAPQ